MRFHYRAHEQLTFMKRSFAVEFIVITLIGLFYFVLHAPALPSTEYSPPALDLHSISSLFLDTNVRPIGTEHERLAGVIVPIQVGLQRYGHVPFWNSYLSNGVPLINNAFNYLLNPFHSFPILLFGGVTGSKIATIIALLIAGYGMWSLGLVIGLGALARVTTALFYMLNGSIAAKFGAGHFQLACSLAWPPLVLAAFWWTLHSSKRRAPILFAVSFALLFYAGNIYYVLHTTICCLVIVALHLIERHQGRWRFRYDRLQRTLIAGLFAFGLSALQFFPVWQVRDFVTHVQQVINNDGTLENSYSIGQAFNNLTQPWPLWGLQHPSKLSDAVDYAYIGNIIFVLVSLAFTQQLISRISRKKQVSWKRHYALAIAAAVILASLMMLWAGGQVQPFPWLYAHIPLLAQFRFLGRALAIASLWWIVLAGIALDILWGWLRDLITTHPITTPKQYKPLLIATYAIAVLGWLFIVIYSASLAPDRIAMAMRNVNIWQQLDTIRYTSLLDALHGLIQILLAVTVIDRLIVVLQHLKNNTRRPRQFLTTWLIAKSLQIALLAAVAFGILDVMAANKDAFQYSTANVPFDAIYDNIRRADKNEPFPSVALPFSPYTFGAYEHEIRVWSLNEGWSPAAPKPIISMVNFANPPRWLIAERNRDGAITSPNVQQFILTAGYEQRACYTADTIMRQVNCGTRQAGFDLYELLQALPYAFVVSEPILTNNATNLALNQVKPADVLLYQQDNIVIHTSATWNDFDKHYLVIQEANFPGWQVTMDGVAVQVFTVPTYVVGDQTLGLIAIPIEQGSHTYNLRFEPPGLSTGILVFCGTLVVILAYLKFTYKQKSPA
ncbi:MAG: hypothetical protein GC179_27055 [Anaerolineaceae bacterium]|nr:hypothetical protein [Anaerolineaceae bacterium]